MVATSTVHQITPLSADPLPSADDLCARLPLSPQASRTVEQGRQGIRALIHGIDDRLLAIVGPCSIHDPHAALEYARRLADLAEELGDRLLLVMRVYLEKPRTGPGWRGLVSDPWLDGSGDIASGLRIGRSLMLAISELGVPVATELLEPLVAPYLSDLVSWAAVGARTVDSPVHRQLASGYPAPVGIKNGLNGSPGSALAALAVASQPSTHLSCGNDGRVCVARSPGNADCHLVLRGGSAGGNCSEAERARVSQSLTEAGLNRRVVVDCSHMNSGRDHRRQVAVCQQVLAPGMRGEGTLAGVMIESNIEEGRQDMAAGRGGLRSGVSVTDACLGWEDTERLLRLTHRTLAARSSTSGRQARSRPCPAPLRPTAPLCR